MGTARDSDLGPAQDTWRGRWPLRVVASGLMLTVTLSACSESRADLTPSEARPDVSTGNALGGPEESGSRSGEASRAESTNEAWAIRIDQFGYRTLDPKVAVIGDPQIGYDAEREFEPGEVYEVRRWSDDEVVIVGSPQPWSNGALHEQSGDRGWWFDFSSVTEPGSYYLSDVDRGVTSGPFEINDDVYDDLLDVALRVFWFNRGNVAHPSELAGPWSDEAAYVGPGQDTSARWVDDPDNPSTELDLSGGWFDAGDTNKYVTFAAEPVHQLLTAYRLYPEVFDDAGGLPESGNGTPDVLDEVEWEIDWLRRMQQEDGGVLTKVGLLEFDSPGTPSSSSLPRYYEESCSSSTIAAAGMFAHASIVFATDPRLAGEAEDLRERAHAAWDWYQTNPAREDCDPQIVKAGDADWSLQDQRRSELVAAVYLFALTGNPEFDSVVKARYAETLAFVDDGFGRYGPEQADALLFYRDLPDVDASVASAIEARITDVIGSSATYGFDPEADLYRAFMPDPQYHWGSNRVKANIGSSNLALDDVPGGLERALGHLHYFHGVNPLSIVYLSNMGDLGAERSARALFHYWFGPGTEFDVESGSEIGVAPGYVVGGPNRAYSGRDSPPAGQPPQKSYRDWSGHGSEPVWQITEPAIYYQAAYVRLLSAIMGTP